MVKLDYQPSEAEAAKHANGKVVPFPIRQSRRVLAEISRQANQSDDREHALRVAICRHGHYLARLGVARELVESEMRSMEWLLLGSVSSERKTKRSAAA